MTTRQGDLALLDHPVAQRLLQSTAPARLAYEDCHHSLDGNVLEAGNKRTIRDRIVFRKHVST